MRNKILITGGTGFIGINLVKKLLQDQNVEIIVAGKKNTKHNQLFMKNFSRNIDRIKLIEIDIINKGILDHVMQDVGIIMHLAAKTQFNSSKASANEIRNTNVLGTKLILESAVKSNAKKFIFFSTSGVYGNRIGSLIMDENHELNPLNPYTKSKLEAEKMALSYYLKYKFPVVIIRPANVYGKHQYPPWMIPLFISKLLNNQTISLNHMGKPKRDWIYVDDLIDSVIMLMKHESNEIFGEVFNVGMGQAISNLEIAKIIVRQLDKSEKLIKLLSAGSVEGLENMAVSNKINKSLGWKPLYSIERGLRETIEWIEENKNLMTE